MFTELLDGCTIVLWNAPIACVMSLHFLDTFLPLKALCFDDFAQLQTRFCKDSRNGRGPRVISCKSRSVEKPYTYSAGLHSVQSFSWGRIAIRLREADRAVAVKTTF